MDGKTQVGVHFTMDDWMIVINLLAEHPFKVSAPLINNIQRQLQAQMQPVATATIQPNGEDRQEAH